MKVEKVVQPFHGLHDTCRQERQGIWAAACPKSHLNLRLDEHKLLGCLNPYGVVLLVAS